MAIWAGLCALSLGRASIGQQTGGVTPQKVASNPASRTETWVSKLTSANGNQAERDEAAIRLAAMGSPDAKAALLATLQSGSRDAQLAVVRALAESNNPDPAMIGPLASLLGVERLTEPAARALALMGSNPLARSRLLDFAGDNSKSPAQRAAVIRACSDIVEKSVALALVSLLNSPSSDVQDAAAAALADLTGLSTIGNDPAGWKRWYDSLAGKSDDQWKLAVYATREVRLDSIAHHQQRIVDQLESVLTQEFEAASDKNATVMRYLNSADPIVRAIGAKVVRNAFVEQIATPTDAQRQRLTELVGDSDADVRLEVASTLKAINYGGALDAMLGQLASESDPKVKAALISAIARIGDIKAVGVLQKLLSDPSAIVLRADLEALRNLGSAYFAADPAGAQSLANDLWKVYTQHAQDPNGVDLAAAAIEAITPLKDEAVEVQLVHLIPDTEQPDSIRVAALHALGELGDRRTDDAIRSTLNQEDQSSAMKLAAIEALGKTGSFGADANELYGYFKHDSKESDPAVRERAWTVFQALLPDASIDLLNNWASQLTQDESKHRLAVLLALVQKLKASHDLENLAVQEESTGETYDQLGQPDQAAKAYQNALDYYLSQPGVSTEMTEQLVNELTTALLRSQQYAPAARFAEKMITRDRAQQQTLGKLFLLEADSLRQQGDDHPDSTAHADALKLIGEVLKMSPPLDSNHLGELKDIQTQLQGKTPSPQ